MGSRRRAREFALQALYALDLGQGEVGDELACLWEQVEFSADEQGYAEQIVFGVVEHLPDLDEALESVSHHWRIPRMPGVDRSILRLAAWEYFYSLEVPVPVLINEAIEVARRFSTTESTSFVNGLLDRLASQVERPGPASEEAGT